MSMRQYKKEMPPKSKTPELIPRVAATLSVFNHTMEMLAGLPETPPPATISKTTLQNAAAFVHRLESQKYYARHIISFFW